ncbi:hypothetical protein J2S77_000165 [Alkalibacillus salilacus]|uniref:Uncharacterized protein n=1 Tax=Alkalibacillus salilacus TaxID=284582 RepID=A0ABT9VB71_9BACI|nr:hypothetical protein [Alkalibacillus salilacus]
MTTRRFLSTYFKGINIKAASHIKGEEAMGYERKRKINQ